MTVRTKNNLSDTNWLTADSAEAWFSTGTTLVPTVEEHPFCDDPNCEWCSDEAYYAGVDALQEERAERVGRY